MIYWSARGSALPTELLEPSAGRRCDSSFTVLGHGDPTTAEPSTLPQEGQPDWLDLPGPVSYDATMNPGNMPQCPPEAHKLVEHQIGATDQQIDQLVYELYQLTDEEIKIAEEATQE